MEISFSTATSNETSGDGNSTYLTGSSGLFAITQDLKKISNLTDSPKMRTYDVNAATDELINNDKNIDLHVTS